MAIVTRTSTKFFPGSVTVVEEPFTCTNYSTMQELATILQSGGILNKHATVRGGKIYSDATAAEIDTKCTEI